MVIDLETSNPLCIDFYSAGPNESSSMLIYGTDQGYTNVFYILNSSISTGFSLKKKKADCIYLEKDAASKFSHWGTLWKRKAHSDWVVSVKFIPFINGIISCSPDPKDSLVLAYIEEHKWIIHSSAVKPYKLTLRFIKVRRALHFLQARQF